MKASVFKAAPSPHEPQQDRTSVDPVALLGGCACGTIRYRSTGAIMASFNCHCTDCRRASGSAFAAAIAVLCDGFTLLAGHPASFTVEADTGARVSRSFCARCGSPLFATSSAEPDKVILQASALDDSGCHQPAIAIFTRDLPTWARPQPDLRSFSTAPGKPTGHRDTLARHRPA